MVFILDTDDLAATFREPFSYMQIGVDWRNDWNNNIDASDVALEFLTTSASGVIVFARGTISGDFLQIRLMGRTRARATMNLGLYELKVLLFCWSHTKAMIELWTWMSEGNLNKMFS